MSSSAEIRQGYLASHVRWTRVDEFTVIVDIKRGEYFLLDKEFSDEWPVLVAALHTGRKSEHLRRLVAAADDHGWLVCNGEVGLPPEYSAWPTLAFLYRRFPTALALFCLARSFLSLRFLGFGKAYAWAENTAQMTGKMPLHEHPIELALKTFLKSERFVISRYKLNDCLPRSIALFVYLRLLGFPVRHFIGVSRFPLMTHAWVADDSVLLDLPGLVREFAPLAVIG